MTALVECRRTGDSPELKVCRWLETIPPDLREKLIVTEIIDADDTGRGEPLAVHLEGKKDEAGDVIVRGYRQYCCPKATPPPALS